MLHYLLQEEKHFFLNQSIIQPKSLPQTPSFYPSACFIFTHFSLFIFEKKSRFGFDTVIIEMYFFLRLVLPITFQEEISELEKF
jgi:hypothetical protein